MVVFTCNNCGDSLQKPRVAKHYQFQCRNSVSLTCVDCFKDFLGDEYVAHTKCITEAERYGSKDYVAKPSANRGEKKQQEWIKIVNNVISGAKNLTKDEKNILQHISKHENIPRKKAKFLNFVKSSMGYRVNMNALESCWTKIEAAFNEINNNKKSLKVQNGDKMMYNDNGKGVNFIDNEVTKTEQDEIIEKKSSKRKRDCKNEDLSDVEQTKVKLNSTEHESNNCLSNHEQQTQEDKNNVVTKVKFDWNSCILNVLGTKNEILLKKLEKKVVAKRLKHSNELTSEKAAARFHKKLRKMTQLDLHGDIVKCIP